MLDALEVLGYRAAAPALLRLQGGRTRVHHDFETYSKADVTKCGSSRYAQHPSTEVLMCAYAFDDEPVRQWVPAEGERIPAELEDAMHDVGIRKFAWNKPFEWAIWKHVLGIDTPHHAWRDPMVLALSLSLPGSLAKAGPVVGLGEDLLKKDGKTLINWFSKPRKPTQKRPTWRVMPWDEPERWAQFLEYNRYDVLAERSIYKRLRQFDLPEHEWDLWVIDQHINTSGLPINMGLVRNAVIVRDEVIRRRLDEMREITGLANPNSGEQLLPWLQERGYAFSDLKKGHVRRALEPLKESGPGNHGEDYVRTLELRLEVSRAAPKKYDALTRHTDEDGFIRNTLQFAAAGRTWRWGGRAYQAHNLARPEKWLEDLEWETTPLGHKKVVGGVQIRAAEAIETLDADEIEAAYADRAKGRSPMDVLAACVRPVIQAPEGYVFIDADLNAIENRGLGWVANDRKILGVFAANRDPYVDFATYMFGRIYEELIAEYKAGDKGPRTTAKPGVLGCGYMLGAGKQYEDSQTGEIEATGLLGYAWNMGVRLTPEEAEHSVATWRSTFSEAVQFWWDIDKAAKDCVRWGRETGCGYVGFDVKKPFMRMILPSDRCLHYVRADIRDWKMPWGKVRPSLTYEQQAESNQWKRVSTHPGKLTENAVQAIARDLIAHGIRLAHQEGLRIVMHVHDQIVAMVREDEADEKLTVLLDCMRDRPKWAPGLPMAAAGHISKWFVKD